MLGIDQSYSRFLGVVSPKFQYFVAGVTINSNKLAFLPRSGFSDCSLNIQFTDRLPDFAMDKHIELDADEVCRSKVYFDKDGKTAYVKATADSDCPQETAIQIRRVVPFSAALQGKITLHASAVRIAESAVCFVAGSGVGKSTFARHLAEAGVLVIADDLLPCRKGQDGIYIPHQDSSETRELQLGAVYFLTRRIEWQKLLVKRIAPKECFRMLTFNGFGEIRDKGVWNTQFFTHGSIASAIPAFHLQIPDDLAKLPRIVGEFLEFENGRRKGRSN